MNVKKEKMIMIFPHLPNPRMIKRITALQNDFSLEVIYWDRETGSEKKNKIPPYIKSTVIKKRANEGNPLDRIGTTIKVLIKALKIIRRSNPAFLYVAKTDMLLISVFYKLFFSKETTLIYEVSDLHSLMIDQQKGRIKQFVSFGLIRLEKFLCKYIKTLVVTSEYFYRDFYSNFLSKEKVLFIPNTPDPEIFNDFVKDENKKFTIGFIGAVRYADQIELLIDAAQFCDVNVLIAGKGKDSFRIEKYAAKYDNIQIYGEYEYDKEIKKLYEKVDCIYSVYDASKKNVQIALPNRLYEALYTETPIIAAKETYLGQIVIDYGLGKVVASDNISELISVIQELKHDYLLLKDIKTNASHLKEKWVLKNYNEMLLNHIKL